MNSREKVESLFQRIWRTHDNDERLATQADYDLFALIRELELEIKHALEDKRAIGKILVAVEADNTITIDGTVAVDVIVSVAGRKPNQPLVKHTLVPSPESEFLMHVYDVLAERVQRGEITTVQLNEKINQ